MSTVINDLRQGIRCALSEFNKSGSFSLTNTDCSYLPGFNNPSLPLNSLVKMYADCVLRGPPNIKETAAHGLFECISHSSPQAMQKCAIKVIGPFIRLLSERQSNAVRIVVVQSLILLVTKVSLILVYVFN